MCKALKTKPSKTLNCVTDRIVWPQCKEALPFLTPGTGCLLVRGSASCKISNGQNILTSNVGGIKREEKIKPGPELSAVSTCDAATTERGPGRPASVDHCISFVILRFAFGETFHDILQVVLCNVATNVIVQSL